MNDLFFPFALIAVCVVVLIGGALVMLLQHVVNNWDRCGPTVTRWGKYVLAFIMLALVPYVIIVGGQHVSTGEPPSHFWYGLYQGYFPLRAFGIGAHVEHEELPTAMARIGYWTGAAAGVLTLYWLSIGSVALFTSLKRNA